jgi:hypothetical protein
MGGIPAIRPHRPPSLEWQVSKLRMGELEGLWRRERILRVPGSAKPLRLTIRRRGPFSNTPEKKYT